MREPQKEIKTFSEFLFSEIQSSIRQDISIEELKEFKKILILQSAPQDLFEKTMKKMLMINQNAGIIVIGQASEEAFFEQYTNSQIQLIAHEERFGPKDKELIQEQINAGETDAIIYFDNFINGEDMFNVQGLLNGFEEKCKIFSYSYVQGELNQILNVHKHMLCTDMYIRLMEFVRDNYM